MMNGISQQLTQMHAAGKGPHPVRREAEHALNQPVSMCSSGDELKDEVSPDLTEDQKRENVIRLAFGGDRQRFEEFVEVLLAGIPDDTAAVLRGSVVTGERWKDGAPFDADGPGTSDLDLTLVGDAAVSLFKITGFFVPGVHSRPISDEDPEIAPGLVRLREDLMALAHRPVNIQATRDFVMWLRGEVIGQPYLTLIGKPDKDA
jgi:hypothetical protein